jgi:hypothetical protein
VTDSNEDNRSSSEPEFTEKRTKTANKKSASNNTINCYTIDRLKQKLDVASGDRVQLNTRIDKTLREMFTELAKKFGASTCEFAEAMILSLVAADRGIEAFLVVTPKLNLVVQAYVVRMVKKRRRKLVQDFDAVEVLPVLGSSDACFNCPNDFGVNKWLAKEELVYLCSRCSKEWIKNGRIRCVRSF